MSRQPSLERLPQALTKGVRFVVWKAELRGDKRTKVPYQPLITHLRASVADPSTWSSFSEATEALNSGRFDGIGRVMGDGLTVIDLDHCRDPQTGRLTPRARWVLRLIDSYAEVSPSGTGLHIWVVGTLPEGRRRAGEWIETYDNQRYMSLTGDHLAGTPTTIEERVAALAYLHADVYRQSSTGGSLTDSQLLGLAATAANGEAFWQLFDGEMERYANDHSAADLALCNYLAFWSRRDRAQMDRLFRTSGLMRPKWDQLRGDRTYGELTLDQACEGCQAVYRSITEDTGTPSRPSFTTDLPSTVGDVGHKDTSRRDSQATQLVRLALNSGAELFPDEERRAYICLPHEAHYEVHALRSNPVRAWATGLFFDKTGTAPGGQAWADALNVLEAHAMRAQARSVSVRIARDHQRVLLDLGDPEWRVVEIDRTGWRVTERSPVPFRRPRGMRPLPLPLRGRGISELRGFLNLRSDADFVLVVGFLLGAFRAAKPYPILVVNGEHGSAKSTLTTLLRELCDPNTAPLRSEPGDARDLMIAASNSHLLSFDNLSTVRLADDLSRLATGAGFSTRMLYENREEELFSAARPIILNGIPELITKPDLGSRSIFISTPAIVDSARRPEADFWAAFNEARPHLLGSLLDLVSTALAHEGSVSLARAPRLADFARWVTAAERVCPWPQGTFLQAFSANQRRAVDDAIDGDVLADAVLDLAPWTGTATALLEAVQARASDEQRRRRDWFRGPRQLRDALHRLAPSLRALGVQVILGERDNTPKRNRLIVLERASAPASDPSSASNGPEPLCDPPGRTEDSTQLTSATASAAKQADLAHMDILDDSDGRVPLSSGEHDSQIHTETPDARTPDKSHV